LALSPATWRSAAKGRLIVSSGWTFPVYSQTFVYQEIDAMKRAGFDLRLFCWRADSRAILPMPFRDLWRQKVVLRDGTWMNHVDLAHFRRTRPERVDNIVRLLARELAVTEQELTDQPVVRRAFTFARSVELARGEYLHTYFFYDQSFMAMVAAYLLGIPRGITAYADHMLNDYPFKCVRLNLALADLVVATSSRIRGELQRIAGNAVEGKILVKPNGIDVSRFPFVTRASTARSGRIDVIAVNRIEPKKGLIYLVKAIGILKDRRLPVRLQIVGSVDPHQPASPAYAAELASLIRELALDDCVVMHGTKPQTVVAELLAESHIFAAPYVETESGDKDGIPTAMLEAMSTGLPVVATDAGSILEAVADGREALCVPQRNPERLADAIERLDGDRELSDRLGRAGRLRVETEFLADVTEPRLHRRIDALIGARREAVAAGLRPAPSSTS
jgi:glycosyltransferase involved in cell wall biosynthesis